MSLTSSIVAAFPAPYQNPDYVSEVKRHLSDAADAYEDDILRAVQDPANCIHSEGVRGHWADNDWAILKGKQVFPLRELTSDKLQNLESSSRIFFLATIVLAVASVVLASYALPFVPVLLTALGCAGTDLCLHTWANETYKKIDGALLTIMAARCWIPDLTFSQNGAKRLIPTTNFSETSLEQRLFFSKILIDLAQNNLPERYDRFYRAGAPIRA